VYLPYCDGTSWTGDAVVSGLHFRGKAILGAIVADLESTLILRQVSQIVISGGSAGASAVFYHAANLARHFALNENSAGVEVLALPDAGFFLDLPDRTNASCWPAQMKSLFEVANGYGALDSNCLTRFPQEKWRCIFPEYYIEDFPVRTLSIHSFYDTSEIVYTLGLTCCMGDWRHCHGQPACKGEDWGLFQALREQHIKAWAPLVRRNGSGVWAPACVAHTMTEHKWTDPTWEVPAGSRNTMAAVVQNWLQNQDSDGHSFTYQDTVAWPHNSPCASEWGM